MLTRGTIMALLPHAGHRVGLWRLQATAADWLLEVRCETCGVVLLQDFIPEDLETPAS